MTEYSPNEYYMSVREDLKDVNGETSIYNRLMDRVFTLHVCSGYMIENKKQLKEKVETLLSRNIDLNNYTVTETDFGWEYEMFVKWIDDGRTFEIVEEGHHTDHEIYTVDITYYSEVIDKFKDLP
jgi:hypothetical protein